MRQVPALNSGNIVHRASQTVAGYVTVIAACRLWRQYIVFWGVRFESRYTDCCDFFFDAACAIQSRKFPRLSLTWVTNAFWPSDKMVQLTKTTRYRVAWWVPTFRRHRLAVFLPYAMTGRCVTALHSAPVPSAPCPGWWRLFMSKRRYQPDRS